MNKFFYLQMDSGNKAPVLLSANRVLGITYVSPTKTSLAYSASTTGDLIDLTHDSDATSTLKMQAFLVDELQKILSTPATGVAPLLIPPVPITAYTLA
jgi:hypothetical protein